MLNNKETKDLQGGGIQIIIPVKIIDIRTRLEVSPGLKLSRHIHSLTAASNLKDGLNKKGEMQNEQQYRNALHVFLMDKKWSCLVKC